MARQKNALRGHFIAPYVKGEKTEVAKDKFLELAKWIKDISDDTDEKKQKMKRIMTVTEPKKPLLLV